jgi:hypothetical protein
MYYNVMHLNIVNYQQKVLKKQIRFSSDSKLYID